VPCGTLLDSVSCRKALLNADRLDLQAPDRRALDEVVFDVLGLTAGEREAVYEAVVNLVRAAGEGTERVICHNVKGTACRALTNNMPCPNNTPRPMARHAAPHMVEQPRNWQHALRS
jgi:hypothetical protein